MYLDLYDWLTILSINANKGIVLAPQRNKSMVKSPPINGFALIVNSPFIPILLFCLSTRFHFKDASKIGNCISNSIGAFLHQYL